MTTPKLFKLMVDGDWLNYTTQRYDTVEELVNDFRLMAGMYDELWIRVRFDGVEQMVRWDRVTRVQDGNGSQSWKS